jgi:hypothetical protein
MTNIPVLVIGYNRPSLLQELLSHLNDIGVKKIYVALDGPKNEQDFLLCEQVYNLVKFNKHRFEIKILHRDYNLGCCLGVISALDWFFAEEDFGAIIEDDCFPKPGFFNFLNLAIENLAHMPASPMRIFSAHNPFDYNFSGQLSNLVLIHGWATYSLVWRKIREDYFKLKLPSFVNNSGEKRQIQQALFWWSNSTRAKLASVDTWDGILNDQVWRLGVKTLIPESNMVRNLGFGPSATHTKDKLQSNQIQLDSEILKYNDLNYLLNKFYFRIKRRHILTALIRISTDLIKLNKPKKFEKLLNQDFLMRKIELP